MSNQEAVLKEKDSCPKCGAGSPHILWDGPDASNNLAIYYGECVNCGCWFSQENELVYKLTTWND
ncbi:hypothetical protein LCGC14_1806420 [marine sediment metagenome]|uniref:Uncharacterized protein n=1 Tax=marine sediment metagenome TaxID=412755 RepID=A0A0F9GMV9_9ZZZZ